ncbi:Ppx/GppA family phosphatase [Mariprofundus erugo]|uniref:Ppx/GppA phosphatase family protein n=1 Tax=Mariprofundus erugo TaxID=2528639 RepID=UPI0010FEAF45|nr:Ppx/GppA phosphatase family protein [Mariprofundus erugo]TLS75048.1 Ppx/GppA family phosphatase [Mariprofundus erugo]
MADRFAAIDIGSNTFRLLIAERSTQSGHTPWSTVCYTHRIIRLGEGLHHTGMLAETAMLRALKAFAEFSTLLQQHGVSTTRTFATATAAMREAANGTDFRDRVKQETGIDIRIIDGEREARLSLSGAGAVLTPSTRNDMLLFDIGGGSTEFIRASHQLCHDAISRKLGVVRLVEAHLHSDPPSAADYQAMLTTIDTHLAEVESFWRDGKAPAYLVGTAGTVTTLAATELDLCPYDAGVINNHRMSRSAFEALRDRLMRMNHAERQTIRTIEPGRADLIIAGLAIIDAIFRRWHYDCMYVVDAGLLEGAWMEISGS